jgi:hypothetical protein
MRQHRLTIYLYILTHVSKLCQSFWQKEKPTVKWAFQWHIACLDLYD